MTDKPVKKQDLSHDLVTDLRKLIDDTRGRVAAAVNSGLTLLYWNIGKRIREDVLKNDRAGYGEEIVASVARQLTAEYGEGFGRRNLFRMIKFAEAFPDLRIVSTLSAQLSWSWRRRSLKQKDLLPMEGAEVAGLTALCKAFHFRLWTSRGGSHSGDRADHNHHSPGTWRRSRLA